VQLAARVARGRRVRRGAEAAGGASSVTREPGGRRERREVRAAGGVSEGGASGAAPAPSGQRAAGRALRAPPAGGAVGARRRARGHVQLPAGGAGGARGRGGRGAQAQVGACSAPH
jgi:hypothetical protein